jgi:hypothetical protein
MSQRFVVRTTGQTGLGLQAHLDDASDAHDASAVSVLDAAAVYTGADVETVLAELPSKFASINFAATSYGLMNPGAGDHTSLIQDALDEAEAPAPLWPAQAKVTLGAHVYNAAGLTVPVGVDLVGDGSRIRSNATGPIVTIGDHGGLHDMHLDGANVVGSEGVVLAGKHGKVSQLLVDAMGLSAVRATDTAVASEIGFVFAQNCLGDAASLSEFTGVLDLRGTDQFVTKGEYTASRSTTTSAGGYACAVAVRGSAHWLTNVLGEISDVGFFVSAAHSQFVGCRSDLNRREGFIFDAASGVVSACVSLNNSRETTNTYDGFLFRNESAMRVDTCRAVAFSPYLFHRYGFNDTQPEAANHNVFGPTNSSQGHQSLPIARTGSLGGARVLAVEGSYHQAGAAATTINVQSFNWPSKTWSLNSVSPVTMTDFTNGIQGMELAIVGDGNTTFAQSAGLRCLSGADTLAAASTIYTFRRHNSVWRMTSISAS